MSADLATFPERTSRGHPGTRPENGRTYAYQGKVAQDAEARGGDRSGQPTAAFRSRRRIRP